ncbi:polysaccharide deacetylase family protein [Kitasatospora sp. NPDC051914]|uniref:polysaccharide deacetylase family protein n=1 Tax=Kitasatospora sp. NPDC051914 TaxID=3154945 RepID=UPI0034186F77
MTDRQKSFSRRSLLAAGAAFALPLGSRTELLGLSFAAPRPSAPGGAKPGRSLLPQLFGEEIRRIPTDERVVALTFNAAWNEDGIDTVLDGLRARGVPATFFLTGRFAESHPEAAEALAAEHGVASHSYSHPELDDLDAQGLREEVARADEAIRWATGAEPLPFYRFPYSETSPDAIAEVNALGYADIEFTDDTLGYLGEAGGIGVDDAVARAVAAIGPGTILQMHLGASDGSGPNVDSRALPYIVDAVESRGYAVIDLGSLV